MPHTYRDDICPDYCTGGTGHGTQVLVMLYMKHDSIMRKTLIFLLISIVICTMTSCLDNTKNEYTPEIYLSQLFLNPYYVGDTLRAQDTLLFHYSELNSTYFTDTFRVGDTVMMGAIFYSAGNNLIASQVQWDTAGLNVWFGLNETVKKALSDTTKIASGYFPYNPIYNQVSFPIYFAPVKSGSHAMKLTVESDSKYSPVSVGFNVIVQ